MINKLEFEDVDLSELANLDVLELLAGMTNELDQCDLRTLIVG